MHILHGGPPKDKRAPPHTREIFLCRPTERGRYCVGSFLSTRIFGGPRVTHVAFSPQTGIVYDPIYTDSLRPNNLHLHTIFTSSNQQLILISVTPFWAVALKLVRYCKWDPGDICALLR